MQTWDALPGRRAANRSLSSALCRVRGEEDVHRPCPRELGRFRRGRSREAVSIQWRRRARAAAAPPGTPPRPHPKSPRPARPGRGRRAQRRGACTPPLTHLPSGPPIARGFGTGWGGSPPRFSAGELPTLSPGPRARGTPASAPGSPGRHVTRGAGRHVTAGGQRLMTFEPALG